jgi:hypothetical protein
MMSMRSPLISSMTDLIRVPRTPTQAPTESTLSSVEWLIPTLGEFWKNYLEPLVPVLGVLLVGALGLAIDGLNLFASALNWVIEALNNGNPIIWGVVAALGALKGALMMQAAFSALSASFATLTNVTIPATMAKMTALRLAITSPMALAVVGVGAAVAALAWLKGEADKTRRAVEGAIRQHKEAANIAGIVTQSRAFGGQSSRGLSIIRGGGLSQINFRADGGHVQAGKPYVVGEEGPELFTPKRSGDIMSNKESMDAVNGGGSQSSSNSYKTEIGTVVLQDSSAVDRFFERIDRNNELAQRGMTTRKALS